MKKIEILIATHRQGDLDELIKKERGLSSADIARLIHQKVGGNVRSISTQYGEFRSGRRKLNVKLIKPLAQILDTSEDFLQELNQSFEGRVLLEFDPKLKFRDFLQDIPTDIATLDRFLVWLSTESQRRVLMSKI